MAIIISAVSQKGGVGKSSVARLIAREYASLGMAVRIADMDSGQTTSVLWNTRRVHYKRSPEIRVECYGTVDAALARAKEVDVLVFDGAPAASRTTAQMALASDLIILPTGLSLDDLLPQTKLANELCNVRPGDREKIRFVFNGVGQSALEIDSARRFVEGQGFRSMTGALSQLSYYRTANDLGQAFSEVSYPKARRAAMALGLEIRVCDALYGKEPNEKTA